MHASTVIGKIAVALMMAPTTVLAQSVERAQETARETGVSGMWILANISYAGMRAQNNRNGGWRIVSFIFGLPGTLLTFLAVAEGGERAYGVELPRRVLPHPSEPAELHFVRRD